MYAFQVYLQILVPKQLLFLLTQENSQQSDATSGQNAKNQSSQATESPKNKAKKNKMVSLQK